MLSLIRSTSFPVARSISPRNFSRTKTMATPALVSTSWLAENLNENKTVVLDGSWHMPNVNRDPKKEFLEKHLPGARFFGIDEIKDHSNHLPHMLPTPQVFADSVGKLGIDNEDHVVVYDVHGILSACRVWWTFKVFGHEKVSVLNGGMPKWLSENRAVESGEPKISAKKYALPVLKNELVRSYEQIRANIQNGPNSPDFELVLDARPEGRFHGTDPEPRPGLSSGHMPHSLSLPFQRVIKDGQLLEPEELKTLFRDLLGKDPSDTRIVTSCGSGITASVLFLALEMVGAKHVALYDESWTGYAGRKESPIVKS
ncbi:uncharacterized protein VTP21DRAFT_4537 [Calcarisporiella thermophila]|uniref:uncharacterized protein n=1 Tax=Calcarisporiella thermophila TaxID=911321 RepID=UPI003743A7D9